ncbi:MAG TPA: pyrroline-5-carboxylate reductase [Erythrobacter sp.]|nr:pyrroline-5-carboxylate reductase [Erythrobacter sp.]
MAILERLLIVGCGNMGGAMLDGWLAAGNDPGRFIVLDPALETVPQGVTLLREASEEMGHDAVLLGFKPQQLGQLASGLQSIVGEGTPLFSLLAGIEVEQLQQSFPNAAAHYRVMPNLAARIGKSPVILAGEGLDSDALRIAVKFFGQLGSAHFLDDESNFDLVTALAGSGPGFVYRFIDALAGAARDLGLPDEMAQHLALEMVEGAACLAAEGEVSPAVLADRVASPGGMTREGLDILDRDSALKQLLIETLRATRDRGTDLAQAAKG